MEILIISKNRRRTRNITLGRKSLYTGFLFMLVLIGAAFLAGNYYRPPVNNEVNASLYQQARISYQRELEKQQELIRQAKKDAENNLDALAARLSKLQGHILRLDALGSRLAAMANIKDIDFDAMKPLGMGGPADASVQPTLEVNDFIVQLDNLGRQIEDRSDKLMAIESMLIDNELQDNTLPAGRPLVGGWISSLFGWRTDPLSGRKDFHEGIDFAGKSSSLVTAVAAGIVTWSDKRYGYGNLVEINHGNGYITRYAHNKKNLVKVGEKVEKGQPVAIIGSSGRSTGTHVHFEVVKNGKHVNPGKYISVN